MTAKKINRFRPPPFIIDTAKYIFNICMGTGIGVKPATDDQYFPVQDIQKIYQEYYGIEYIPTLMVPSLFTEDNDMLYYPLQCPFAKINTFKNNQSHSTLTILETLKNVLLTYQQEFADAHHEAYGSPLYRVSKQTNFSFYHYQATGDNMIKHSSALLTIDPRFSFAFCNSEAQFASDAKLFRGCVLLKR